LNSECKFTIQDATPFLVAGKSLGYARICLNPQSHLQKSILTTKPASVIWMGIGFVELMPQYMGPQLMPIHNSYFSVIRTEKTMSYLFPQGKDVGGRMG
jgi:hypothetical protein